MKKHKTHDNRNFEVNSHTVNVDLFTQCVTSNPQERSYHKKQCKLIFLDDPKENGREYTQIYFTNMRAAVVFIANHIDLGSMKFNAFGKSYLVRMAFLSCNYKLYAINNIDGRDPWANFI